MNIVLKSFSLGLLLGLASLKGMSVSLSAEKTGSPVECVITTGDGSLRCCYDDIKNFEFFMQQEMSFDDATSFDCSTISCNRLNNAFHVYKTIKKDLAEIDQFTDDDLRNALIDLDYLGLNDQQLLKDIAFEVSASNSIKLHDQERRVIEQLSPNDVETLIVNDKVGNQKKNREWFELGHLQLQNLGGIQHLKDLASLKRDQIRGLNLSFNSFHAVAPSSSACLKGVFPQLREIDFSYNKIKRLTKRDLHHLKKACPALKRINFAHNDIERLDEECISELEGMRIDLSHNPLVELPMRQLRDLEGAYLKITNTPYAKNIETRHIPGFTKGTCHFQTEPITFKHIRFLREGIAAQDLSRALLLLGVAGLNKLSNCLQHILPQQILTATKVLQYGTMSFLIGETLSAKVILLLYILAFDGETLGNLYTSCPMLKSPLDLIFERVFPKYGRPYKPTRIYFL